MRAPRPLARILSPKARGGARGDLEAAASARRDDRRREAARLQAQGRLLVLAGFFFVAFGAVGFRMGTVAAAVPDDGSNGPRSHIAAQRADITDREGRVLATNLFTHALYVHPHQMIDRAAAARRLVEIFPDLDEAELLELFESERRFAWIKKQLSPEQRQQVHDIGDPGLLFAPREMRLYPNGRLAAHILGGATFGEEGTDGAEVLGVAGVERALDARLRDEADRPLALSIDLTAQAVMAEVLGSGMRMLDAKGAAGILMDVHTGEIIAMASLPDFDPNDRPAPAVTGDPGASPLFNRSVQGLYELGSTFKILTAAQAMEIGIAGPHTPVDAEAPMRWKRHTIREYRNRNYGPTLSVTDVIVKSSNVGTGRLALAIGAERQKAFLQSLGLFDPTQVELVEAAGARPLLPNVWSEIVTITASYGHGFSASPLHLAAAYATLGNGGRRVTPTILRQDAPILGERVISEKVARDAVHMLREVVVRGTATGASVPGYEVAGKTGTANKPRTDGRGYYDDRNIVTFAAVFPAGNPKYSLVVTLDEAVDTAGERPHRTAGSTAVPVASEVIERIGPVLGLRPTPTPTPGAVTAAASQ